MRKDAGILKRKNVTLKTQNCISLYLRIKPCKDPNIIYKACLCASALTLWNFSSILSPTTEKPAPTRSPLVTSRREKN